MQDDVAGFIAWLGKPQLFCTGSGPVANADPLQARVAAARPNPAQVDVDRCIENYDLEWGWQHDTAFESQLSYLRSLLRRENLFPAGRDAAYMTQCQASHMIDLLTGPDYRS